MKRNFSTREMKRWKKILICEISVPQSGVAEVSWPLGFDAVSTDKGVLTFRMHYDPSKRR